MGDPRAVFSDADGNLFDINFQQVTKSEEFRNALIQIPVPANSASKAQYETVFSMWRDRVVVSAGGYILSQPISLFFRRPLTPAQLGFRKFAPKLVPCEVCQLESYITNGTAFDEKTELVNPNRPAKLRVSKCLSLKDTWCAWRAPTFPDPNLYDTFEDFEKAGGRWLALAKSALQTQDSQANERHPSFMHPSTFMDQSRELVTQLPKQIFRISDIPEQKPKLLDIEIATDVPFTGKNMRMHDLQVAYILRSKKGFATSHRAGDMGILEYEKYGCIRDIGPAIPNALTMPVPPSKAIIDQWLQLPFVSLECERILFLTLCRMIKERNFTFHKSLQSLYRAVLVFRAFLRCQLNIPIIEPQLDLLAQLKDAKLFWEAYNIFFEVYLWNVLRKIIVKGGLTDLSNQIETMAGKERTLLVYYISERHKDLVNFIKQRQIEGPFGMILGSLICIASLFSEEIIMNFVEEAFCPSLVIFSQISQLSPPVFSQLCWKILSSRRLVRAMLRDFFSGSISGALQMKKTTLTLQILIYLRWLLHADESVLPDKIYESTKWPNDLWPLFNVLKSSGNTATALKIMDLAVDLMRRRWLTNRSNAAGWAETSQRMQFILLPIMGMDDVRRDPTNTLLLITTFRRTITCKESLKVFQLDEKSLSPFVAMCTSSDMRIRTTAWSSLRIAFHFHLEQALELTDSPAFRKFMFPLLTMGDLRVDALRFITDIVGLTEKERSGKSYQFKKRRAVSVFLKFIKDSKYSFLWYFTSSSRREARETRGKDMRKIDESMKRDYVDSQIKTILDTETKDRIQEEAKAKKKQGKTRKPA